MRTRAQQAGFTFTGLIMWFIIGGFVVYMGFKLGPIYIENRTIQSILESFRTDSAINSNALLSTGSIRSQLEKGLRMNEIRRFDNKEDSIAIKRVDTRITIEYEVRQHVMGNADVILSFSNSVDVKTSN